MTRLAFWILTPAILCVAGWLIGRKQREARRWDRYVSSHNRHGVAGERHTRWG